MIRFRAWSLILTLASVATVARAANLTEVIADVQPKIVKVYGAGGFRGLEAYQSGFLISADGRILTAWSYVLDTDYISVTLNDGRKLEAKLLGADAAREVAVLKVEATDLPCFDLGQSAPTDAGTPVLAFSNVFGVAVGDEPASIQHGIIAVKTQLAARRGTYEMPYRGDVYVLDAMTNNPGAAGGALTDYQGQLVALLGKEVRNAATGTWLNYALPIPDLTAAIEKLSAGGFVASEQPETKKPAESLSTELLGLVTVPDVVERTPPFLDQVRPGSPAATAGLRADDLIVSINGRLVPSVRSFQAELETLDRADEVALTVMRENELIEVVIRAPSAADIPPDENVKSE